MSFITFEGIDCSGKTTQIALLKERFASNKNIVFTSNPGDTHLGNELRKILLHRSNLKVSGINEVFLFFAGILDNYEKIILPTLSQGKIVFCDRYYDSTIAYQGFGHGLDVGKIIKLLEVSALPEPNLTFLFRIIYSDFSLRSQKKEKKDKIENLKEQFYAGVIEGYDELAKIYKNRYIILDGTKPIEVLQKEIIEILKEKLGI